MTPESGSVDRSGAGPGPVRAPFRCVTVQRQFDRRAPGFAGASAVVREVGGRLFERLDTIRHEAGLVVDLGCGAGLQRAALLKRFAHATWIGIDLSRGMLAQAADEASAFVRRLPRALQPRSRTLRVCANADRLPLADASADCVFSNLMLHWHPAPHQVFPEVARVLREGGLFLFSSLGPDTLRELRQACALALAHPRPMPFVDMHDLGDMMVAAGFSSPVTDSETIRLTYGSARQLLAEVRVLGGNPRDDRDPGLPSGRRARALVAELEAQRGGDGRIGLTFEISYGLGWKAPPRASAGSATTISVEALRGQLRRR
ncbi:MAG TPA: methyltransferase domain-containing protein [Burkholderiaceae bacterium]|nr:methyltransferase domain-containing protein [Burkholderiaceae bacterium]